ncbi:hypothetical protein [Aeromicrobium sp.]|uniref:hypothetical protein n=1 Tax=Aeromicrobium sp. TaxID=1871063 RepID=UPI002FCC680A
MTMRAPDPERLGGLAWTIRTQGAMTKTERRTVLREIIKGQAEYVAGRIKLLTGRTSDAAKVLEASSFTPPDSVFARQAEEAALEQSSAVMGHGYRTWMFGSGLAAIDQIELDPELFYVSALLHDHGIDSVVEGQDFTIRSAERAARCASEAGVDAARSDLVGDAITVHPTAGATVERDGALGVYVGGGAAYDLIGLRTPDLSKRFRADVIEAHPRAGATKAFKALVAAESKSVPLGRFAQLHRCGFNQLIQLAPLRPR